MYLRTKLIRNNRHAGFTLIELLVTISIIAVLAGISLPVYRTATLNARRIKGLANIRSAGTAVMVYAGENNNTLPGPCGLGIIPTCNSSSKTNGDLAGFIAPYLGVTIPTNSTYVIVPALVSPGMTAYNKSFALATSRIPHYIQTDVFRGNGNTGGSVTIRPFGYTGGNAPNDPLRLTRLGDLTNAAGQSVPSAKVWLLTDVDQPLADQQLANGNTQAHDAGWYGSLPTKPVYVTNRLRMYADGHAEAASLTEQ